MVLYGLGRGPVLFHHGLGGKEKQCSISPKNLPSLSRHWDGGEEAMADSARGCRGAQGRPFAFIDPLCHNQAGKVMTLTRRSKRHNKPMFTRLLDSSHIVPAMTAQDTETVCRMAP
jgi:hypothetical protein